MTDLAWILPYGDFILKSLIAVGACFSFIIYVRTELADLRSNIIKVMEHQKIFMESLKQLNTILTQIAVQDTRLNMIEKDIDELRHGQGFIK